MTYDFDRLAATLERHEGFRSKPYRDTVGKLTIGLGRNLDDVGVTREEARYLLRSDLEKAQKDLDKHLPWWRTLDPVRQEVMLNLCFNMGIGNSKRGLLSFVNTLRMIQFGRYQDAAAAMLKSKWARQVGKRADELAHMMKTGKTV